MIRVVVTGSECTGKTTLARALAEHYEAPWIPEYARQFVLDKGNAPEYQDVDSMARGQIALEKPFRADGPRLIVQDTDLLSTAIYSRHYYGDCPAWIDQALAERRGDLYLLAGIDVPWTPDHNQRDRGDRREEMQDLFRAALTELEFSFVEIVGLLPDRLRESVAAIRKEWPSEGWSPGPSL